MPRRDLRGEEDFRARCSGFLHESSDGIGARLFVAVGASGIDVAVPGGEGVKGDGFAFSGGSGGLTSVSGIEYRGK